MEKFAGLQRGCVVCTYSYHTRGHGKEIIIRERVAFNLTSIYVYAAGAMCESQWEWLDFSKA